MQNRFRFQRKWSPWLVVLTSFATPAWAGPSDGGGRPSSKSKPAPDAARRGSIPALPGVPASWGPGLTSSQTSTIGGLEPVADDDLVAQAPPAETDAGLNEEEEGADVEDVVVTGTRIRRKDLVTPAPVTVVDAQAINASGLVSIGEILQNLPSQGNAVNVQLNNGGNGTTRIDLRGFGSARTLVLINGRRVVSAGLGADISPDLDVIPIAIIDRIEILRDGGSAIYGSDAIGGVVNVITKRDFSGVEAFAYYGGSQYGGPIFQSAITLGETTEKSSFVVNASFFNQEPLFAGQRDFASPGRNLAGFNFPFGDEETAGSSATPQGTLPNAGGGGNAAWQNVVERSGGHLGNYYNDPIDGWRQANFAGASDVGDGDLFNFRPENYIVTPSQRFSLYTQGEYSITDKIRIYAEGLYSGRQSDRLIAQEPVFTGQFLNTPISADSVYNPFGRDFIAVNRRMVEQGNRVDTDSSHTYRVVLGLEGDYPDNWGKLSTWRWDANFNYGFTNTASEEEGRFVVSRIRNAIGPSFFDDRGIARCGTPDAIIAGCVPLNFLGGEGTITQEMLDYISFSGTDRGYSEQRIVTVETGGELFDLWDLPAGLVIGFQHRFEGGGELPNSQKALAESSGNNATETGGDFTEVAGYAEISIPVLANLPAFELFEVTAALRVFDFDTIGSDIMYKFSGLWRIGAGVSLRGNYSRAFRAPNVNELFLGASDGFPFIDDPCEGGGSTPNEIANCTADGAPPDLNDGVNQLRTTFGGNEDLEPETADIITAGIVWEPTFIEFLRGFSATVDFYSINIDNAIDNRSANQILQNCFGRDPADRRNCEDIERDENFFITRLQDLNDNLGGFDTYGLDIAANYTKGTPIGRIALNFVGNWTGQWESIDEFGQVTSGLGQFDLDNVTAGFWPRWRFNAGAQWAKDGVGLGYNVRYIDGLVECQGNLCSTQTDSNRLARGIEPNVTMDVYASYAFTSPVGFSTIRAGINNFLDQDPPLIYQGFLGNSSAENYDYLGRFFYVSLNHRL